ncbi:MAG: bifunctional diguanylate cyclase/phosphohydrolase [Thermoleophilaceae bacterium]
MARTLAYLFAAGAALALLSIALPGAVEVPKPVLGVAIAVAAMTATVSTALAMRGTALLRGFLFQLGLAAGSAVVTAAVWTDGPGSRYALFYVLIALYSAYFFTRVQTAVQVMLALSAYAVAELARHPSGGDFARWLLTAGVIAVATTLVFALKERLEGVITRLEEAARTDVLTGLLNRRGFIETFETELERAKRSGRELSLIVGDLDRFKELNDKRGHGAGDDALERLAAVMGSAKRRIDSAARVGGEEFALVVPETDEHEAFMLAERLRIAVRDAFAAGDPALTISFGVAMYPKHGHSADALLLAGDRALYAAKELGRDRTVIHNPEVAEVIAGVAERARDYGDGFLATVMALAEALELRAQGGVSSSRVVSRYAELVARELQLSEEVVERVRIGGLLHDVGKIGVAENVLNKPEPLDDGDWQEIRRHPLIAARILDSSAVADIRDWIVSHHERPDGQGYPHGLTGEEIPLEARILGVADAYEAMTSERIYRTALTPSEARAELMRGAGSQFDERVVKAFVCVLDRLGVPQ